MRAQPLLSFFLSSFLFLSIPFPAASARAEAAEPVLTFLGDSLTAGYGVAETEAYPALVQAELRSRGYTLTIVNAGVSGDTTQSALARLGWVLKRKPKWVVIELGANDMLRGVPTERTERNLSELIRLVRASGAEPILFGMRATPNLGPQFVRRFDALYPAIAKKEKLTYLPLFLEPVVGKRALNQADGIHPTAEGHRRIATLVAEFLVKTTLKKTLVP